MSFSLEVIDWTAIGAIITALMVIVTLITVIQNRGQLKELKRQWAYEHRPHILLSIIPRTHGYYLKIQNVGNASANEVYIKINDAFKATFDDDLTEYVENLSKPFPMAANTSSYVFLGWIDKLNKIWENNIKVEISCFYDGFKEELKDSSENFIDKRFFMFYNYQEEILDNIKKELIKTNRELSRIESSINKLQPPKE